MSGDHDYPEWECGVCGATVSGSQPCHTECCNNEPGMCHSEDITYV